MENGNRNHLWTSEEDGSLLMQISLQTQNRHNWKRISSHISGRTSRQCYDRFLQLQKKKKKVATPRHNWKEDEKKLFDEVKEQYQFDWGRMQKDHFPQLLSEQLKNRHQTLMKIEMRIQRQEAKERLEVVEQIQQLFERNSKSEE